MRSVDRHLDSPASTCNSDGLVTRNEWNMSNADFNRLDVNRDNRVSRFEFENDTAAYNDIPYSAAQFNAFDTNRDGWLTRPNPDAHRRIRPSRSNETIASAGSNSRMGDRSTRRTAAARGVQATTGIQEGRAAGREDQSPSGWDLEGQRELEQANSGYTPQMGTLSDYQAGYREGFRSAYRAGFAEAGGTPPR